MADADNYFGDSPFLNDGVTGGSKNGRIAMSSTTSTYILVAFLIVFIVYLLYKIIIQVKISGENYHQRSLHYHFNNIRGEDYDDEAKHAIEVGENMDDPRAIDHYRMGAVYLVNARNPKLAHFHFTQALGQIIAGNVTTRDAPFIINRVDDFKDQFMDFPDIEELPIQEALQAFYHQQVKQINHVAKAKEEISPDDPEFRQKVILSRQEWQSDSQNVHDSAMYDELKRQYLKVFEENMKVPNIQVHDYREATNWLKAKFAGDPEKSAKLTKILNRINENAPVNCIPNATETDLLTTVWQRSYDPENKEHADTMREAMADAVMDCDENGAIVCLSGRTKKVWQALARVDKEEDMGILKSKQAIRNEILQKCAKVVNDYVGKEGSASQALKDAYNNSENTEQVKELTETIKKQIDTVGQEYNTMLPKDQLELIVAECKAVV